MPGRVCHGPRRSAEAGGIEDASLNASVVEDYEACWILHAALVICLSYAAHKKMRPGKTCRAHLMLLRSCPDTRHKTLLHSLLGRNHHDHLAAFHFWLCLDLDVIFTQLITNAHQHVHAFFLVCQLSATEANGEFHLVAFF